MLAWDMGLGGAAYVVRLRLPAASPGGCQQAEVSPHLEACPGKLGHSSWSACLSISDQAGTREWWTWGPRHSAGCELSGTWPLGVPMWHK